MFAANFEPEVHHRLRTRALSENFFSTARDIESGGKFVQGEYHNGVVQSVFAVLLRRDTLTAGRSRSRSREAASGRELCMPGSSVREDYSQNKIFVHNNKGNSVYGGMQRVNCQYRVVVAGVDSQP